MRYGSRQVLSGVRNRLWVDCCLLFARRRSKEGCMRVLSISWFVAAAHPASPAPAKLFAATPCGLPGT